MKKNNVNEEEEICKKNINLKKKEGTNERKQRNRKERMKM